MNNKCEIKFNHIVKWNIYKKNIVQQLIGKLDRYNKYSGLLYLDYEAAGEIDFENTNCKLKDNEEICDKHTKKNISFKKGSNDSVITPNAVINFHTHPLSCYIEAQTIWGWPSGEDLARSIEFAISNNLCHIVFAVEGTYIIDVNKQILLDLKLLDNNIIKDIIYNIEKIIQLTHKHRMYYNDNSSNISLDDEFYLFFMKKLNLEKKENILYNWLLLINNLDIENLIKLGNICLSKLGESFNLKNLEKYNIDKKFSKIKIFNITFKKNKTVQWDKKFKNKETLFHYLNEHQYNLLIDLPKNINYKAAFISEECKL